MENELPGTLQRKRLFKNSWALTLVFFPNPEEGVVFLVLFKNQENVYKYSCRWICSCTFFWKEGVSSV